MDKIEKRIINFYKKKFFSVQQISDDLKINSAKVRYVLYKNKVEKRSISEAIRLLNVTKFNKKIFHAKENLNDYENRLKIAGVMLYWGEGTKDGNTVAFSNSNPEMVLLFLKFLRKICNISEDRIRALIHIYEDQDESVVKKYWSNKLSIPMIQFNKSFLHKRKKGSYKKNSVYGTISLRYSDAALLRLINKWIGDYTVSL